MNTVYSVLITGVVAAFVAGLFGLGTLLLANGHEEDDGGQCAAGMACYVLLFLLFS
jgi:hypothetical protein